MKYALQVAENGDQRIVDASGKPLGQGDADVPVFHFLPKLLVPASAVETGRGGFGGITCDEVSLKVTSSLDRDVVPEGGIRIRQPYPNRRYFVAGSDLIRIGWMVPLALDVTEFDIELEWSIESAGLWPVLHADVWTIRHSMHITLLPGRGITYTMDSACWDNREAAPIHTTPVTHLEKREMADEQYKHREVVRVSDLVFKEPDGQPESDLAGHAIEEKVSIAGIPLDGLWTVHAFDEEQIHEVTHSALFKTGAYEHRQNALVEMPAEVFVAAVEAARGTPFGKGSKFAKSVKGVPGGCEQHPALRTLCGWWESARPEGEPFKPGFAMPLVRVRDDGQYWWGYCEIPNVSVDGFNPGGRNVASIGDLMLVEFSATQSAAIFDEAGFMNIMLPNGDKGSSVGVGKEEYLKGEFDEAWYSLTALAGFPERFPSAWRFLNKKGREYAQAARAAVAVSVALPDDVSLCRDCDCKPTVTFDPTQGAKHPYVLTCQDHYFQHGETLGDVLMVWDNDQSEAYAKWLQETAEELLAQFDQEASGGEGDEQV